MISIIIPTLNEEKYLPRLLKSIKNQDYQDYEIIIADAGSTDKTIEIAKKYNCKIVPGGSPAVGRNNGAKAAKGEYLLFLDADVILEKNFLKNLLQEFNNSNADIATSYIVPLSNKKIDFILHNTVNVYFRATQKIYPHAPGFCILVKKDIHHAVNGFDEKIKLAEDHDYVRRAKNYGRFKVVRFPKILVSTRRLDTDGRINIAVKYLLCEMHRIIIGEVKTNIFNYQFAHYDKKRKQVKIPKYILQKIEKTIIQFFKKNKILPEIENKLSKIESKIKIKTKK